LLKEAIKNLFKKKATVEYPLKKAPAPERFRGRHDYIRPKCISCGACIRICPNDVIRFATPKEKKRPPPQKGLGIIIDLKGCIFCGLCDEVCPTKCLKMTQNYEMATSKEKELYIR